MSEIKLGDRVACYDIFHGRRVGTVVDIEDQEIIFVLFKKNDGYRYHRKQCRKLVKKEFIACICCSGTGIGEIDPDKNRFPQCLACNGWGKIRML